MTDTFSSGSSAPLGGAQPDSQPARDVTGALAELERKLRELEQELTSIGRRRLRPDTTVVQAPVAATATGPSAATPPGGSSTATPPAGPSTTATPAEPTGRLIDERAEPEPQAEHAGVEWATPAERATPVQEFAPAAGRMGLGDATSSDSPVSPSDAQLAGLAELRSFRDRVERFATELTADYDAMLGRVMATLSGRGGEPSFEPTGTAVTTGPRLGEPLAPARAEPGPEEALFEGRVELGVGPFYDIASLGAFEQNVASLPGVSEVAVRRFEASHAVVDLRLATPVALVGELRRALPTGFSIRQVAEGRMLLTFDDS
jgi:hypothetical protein